MMSIKRFRTVCLAAGLMVTGLLTFFVIDESLNLGRNLLVPKNFSAVRSGVLYRSGQLRPEHFAEVIQRHQIRTVICLNPGEDNGEAERSRRLGVRWLSFSMPGSGRGDVADFAEVLRVIARPSNRPVLVHCQAGAYRTGVAVALYRMALEHWPSEEAFREMEYFGCRIDVDPALQKFVTDSFEELSRPSKFIAEDESSAPPNQTLQGN